MVGEKGQRTREKDKEGEKMAKKGIEFLRLYSTGF